MNEFCEINLRIDTWGMWLKNKFGMCSQKREMKYLTNGASYILIDPFDLILILWTQQELISHFLVNKDTKSQVYIWYKVASSSAIASSKSKSQSGNWVDLWVYSG